MRYLRLSKQKNELKRLTKVGIVMLAGALVWMSPLNPFNLSHASAAAVTVDSTVIATNNANVFRNNNRRQVFISDQVGYIFYQDSDGTCVYSKSTDAGATWGTAVVVDAQTDCIDTSVWYDRWTPGDNTGTKIYIITFDTGSDDLWYNVLDTSSDTLANGSAPVSVTSLPGPDKTNSLVAGNAHPPIVKGTDGVLYTGINDSSGSYVIKCSTSCSTASNWSDAGTIPLNANDIDTFALVPTLGGTIMAIRLDATTNNRESVTWNGSSWSASWTVIMTTGAVQTADQALINATVNRTTGDIYMVTVADNATYGTDDDINTAVWTHSNSTWTTKTDVVTNSGVATGAVCAGVTGTGSGTGCGVVAAQLAVDDNTGDIYCVYAARTTSGTAATGEVYWTKSTNGMTTWNTQSGPLNATGTNISGVFVNEASNERLFVSWNDVGLDTLVGDTMVDLTPPTGSAITQSAYHWYSNTNGITPNGSFANENTAASVPCGVGPLRLRTGLTIGTSALTAGSTQFKLQYGTSTSGPWTDVGAAGGTTPLMSDDFTGTDGTAWDTNKWVSTQTPTGASTSIQTNQGKLVTGTGGMITTPLIRKVNLADRQDSQIYAKINLNSAANNDIKLVLRSDGAANPTQYDLDLETSFPYPSFEVMSAGNCSGCTSFDPGFSITSGVDYDVRFKIVGTSVSIKIWLDGGAEPANWTYQTTNSSITAAGKTEVVASNNDTGVSKTSYIDNFILTDGSDYSGAASLFANYDNPGVTDGATLSAAKLSGSPTLESYVESGTTPVNPNSIAISGKGEWDFALNAASAPPNTYYFRMVKSDGTVLNTYSVYPTLTITSAPSMDSVMMHGTFFAGESKQPMACSYLTAPT